MDMWISLIVVIILRYKGQISHIPLYTLNNPLQYSCLENPMDREAGQAIVHRVAKSRTRQKQLSMQQHTLNIYSFYLPVSYTSIKLWEEARNKWIQLKRKKENMSPTKGNVVSWNRKRTEAETLMPFE